MHCSPFGCNANDTSADIAMHLAIFRNSLMRKSDCSRWCCLTWRESRAPLITEWRLSSRGQILLWCCSNHKVYEPLRWAALRDFVVLSWCHSGFPKVGAYSHSKSKRRSGLEHRARFWLMMVTQHRPCMLRHQSKWHNTAICVGRSHVLTIKCWCKCTYSKYTEIHASSCLRIGFLGLVQPCAHRSISCTYVHVISLQRKVYYIYAVYMQFSWIIKCCVVSLAYSMI